MKELRWEVMDYLMKVPNMDKAKVISIWSKLETKEKLLKMMEWLKLQELENLKYTPIIEKALEIQKK